MFIGEYSHSVDSKGRIIVPAKFRTGLGERFILTKGLDNCLFVFPEKEWEIFEEKLKRLPLTSRDARAFVRLFFSGAAICERDRQGRMTLPANLKKHANINKDVITIGVSTRIEIWGKEEWGKYNQAVNLSYDDIADKMAGLGI